ncbi:MAG: sigma-70 family RNA polymerase sigma factor [Eubacteriales bacterium]|nr:sigma-70 family RNA polymerase sigma factor [Eubacteriales bacterium]
MTDEKILELYFSRSEDAIAQTDAAYGKRLFGLANRLLSSREDAEESVSDTYFKTWNAIPPQRPRHFYGFLAQICRFTAMDRLDWRTAAKRQADVVALTAEMESCIPDRSRERQLEARALGRLLNEFLEGLPADSRMIFLRRYWYVDTVAEIARRYAMTESKVKTQLHRTRKKLEAFLMQERIAV